MFLPGAFQLRRERSSPVGMKPCWLVQVPAVSNRPAQEALAAQAVGTNSYGVAGSAWFIPSAVGRKGRAGRRRCRLAMYLRDETTAPMVRNQISVRGNQCRESDGVDGAERIGLVFNVACSMSLRRNDFPHRDTHLW